MKYEIELNITPAMREAMDTRCRIVCAAILHVPTGAMLVGPRHYDPVMRMQLEQLPFNMTPSKTVQGFIDQWGRFHNRKEAYVIAEKAGQILHKHGSSEELYSEDLY